MELQRVLHMVPKGDSYHVQLKSGRSKMRNSQVTNDVADQFNDGINNMKDINGALLGEIVVNHNR